MTEEKRTQDHWQRMYYRVAPISAEQVKKIRTRLGLSQWALAQMLGTSQARVSDWERGQHKIGRTMRQRLFEIVQFSDDPKRFTRFYE